MIIASPKLIVNPLVSIFIITYNQEKTIAQTIESILMQEGDFSLELIIGEDAGTDGTRQICIDYQQRYPESIKLLLQDTNQGIVKNYIDLIKLCRGKYMGVCAGDDYWIDKNKISKQLDFFASHPDYGVVTTGGYRLLVKQNKLVEGIPPLNPVVGGDVFHLTYKGGVYAMPLSLLFRRELLQYLDLDEFLKRKFSVEDVPMQAIMAKHTKFGHIPDLTCVYRVYNESVTFTNFNSPRYIYYHQGLVEIKRYLNELFPGEVEFSEQWAHDYMVYRRFLVAVYNVDFSEAKKQLSTFKNISAKEQRAKQYSRTRIGFYVFCLVKRYKLLKSKTV
jgi:glycosyltransferase involved in cell wall biosynthesis